MLKLLKYSIPEKADTKQNIYKNYTDEPIHDTDFDSHTRMIIIRRKSKKTNYKQMNRAITNFLTQFYLACRSTRA